MKLRSRLSSRAALDLEAIVEYYHPLSPATARRYYDGSRNTIRRLPALPEIGRTVPEFLDDDITSCREIIYDTYRILCQLSAETITVVRIIDSRRLMTVDIIRDSQAAMPRSKLMAMPRRHAT